MKIGHAAWIFVLAGVVAGVARGQGSAENDRVFFERHISSLVKVEPQAIPAAAEIGKVFSGTFFTVDVTLGDNSEKVIAVRSGDELVQVAKPSTTAKMPELTKLVKPEFKLAGEADAKAFEVALDAIYPIDATFNKDDLKVKAIKQKGDEWTFIRGKFFEHFKGFVVTTKADGTISEITYSLDIP